MGKRTTTRHKEDNTFRFESFLTKISKINSNTSLDLHDEIQYDDSTESRTFLYQAIQVNSEKNNATDFLELVEKLLPFSKSLEQIIHKKKFIISTLLIHLNDKEKQDNSFKETTDLTVALAKDLKREFEPSFRKFIVCITNILLNTKSVDIIAAGFQCFAKLFKTVRAQVVNKYESYLQLVAVFWSPQHPNYVSLFAAQCFTEVSRRAWKISPQMFFNRLVSLLEKDNDTVSGIQTLLLEMMKGVNGQLHLSGQSFFDSALEVFVTLDHFEGRQQIWKGVMQNVVRSMASCFSNECCAFISTIEEFVTKVLNTKSTLTDNNDVENLEICYTELFCILVSCRPAVIHHDSERRVRFVRNFLTSVFKRDEKTRKIGFELVVILIEFLKDKQDLIKLLKEAVEHLSTSELNQLEWHLLEHGYVISEYGELLIRAFLHCHSQKLPELESDLEEARIMTNLLSNFIMVTGKSSTLDVRSMTELDSFYHDFGFACCKMSILMKYPLGDLLEEYLLRTFLVVRNLDLCVICKKSYTTLVVQLFQGFPTTSHEKSYQMLLATLYYGTQLVLSISPHEILYGENELSRASMVKWLWPRVIFSKESFSVWALKLLQALLEFSIRIDGMINTQAFLESLTCKSDLNYTWKFLLPNLRCGFRKVRNLTLSIMKMWKDCNRGAIGDLLQRIKINDSCNPFLPSFVTSTTQCIMNFQYSTADELEIIFNYTLGLLFTNHKVVWERCIDMLKLKFSEFKKLHPELGSSAFPIFDLIFTSRKQLLQATTRSTKDFYEMAEIVNFSLPEWKTVENELEEKLDFDQYITNYYYSLQGLIEQEDVRDSLYYKLKAIIEAVLGNINGDNCEEMDTTKYKILLPLLQFFTKVSLKNPEQEKLYNYVIDLLLQRQFASAALELLLHIKPKQLKPYMDEMKQVNEGKNIGVMSRFGVDVQSPLVLEQHRKFVIPIILRMLLRRCRNAKKIFRNAVVRQVGGFTEEENNQFIDLAMRDVKDPNVTYKTLQSRLNLILATLRILRYKYPNILEKLIGITCDIIQYLPLILPKMELESEVKPSDDRTVKKNWEEKQEKQVIKMARLCILSYFEWFPKLDFRQSLLERIFDLFVYPSICTCLSSRDMSSTEWIIQLFKIWSSNPRYHMLLTKNSECECKTVSPMRYLFDVLSESQITVELKIHVLNTLMSLTAEVDVDDAEQPIVMPGCEDLSTGHSIGRSIILQGKEIILKAMRDPQIFKSFCSRGGAQRLSLIAQLTEYVDDSKWNTELCDLLIKTLPLCKKRSEDSIFYCLKSIGHTLKKAELQDNLLLMLGPSFAWVTGRRLRTALCEVLNSIREEYDVLKEILQGLNSWENKASDTPDFMRRQKCYESSKHIVSKRFDEIFYTLVAFNCFHALNEIDDFGESNSAMRVLEEMSKYNPTGVEADTKKKFIKNVVLAGVLKGLKLQDEKKFQSFLHVLNTFILNARSIHGTLNELGFLADLKVLEGLTDIKIHMRTRNMNRLAKHLEEMKLTNARISSAVITYYVIPIAWHNLDNEELLHDNRNELIDSSIQVLFHALALLPYTSYLIFLTYILNKPIQHQRLFKQRERILMTVMDAFHFDLSSVASVSEEPTLEVSYDAPMREPERESVDTSKPGSIDVLDKESSVKCVQTLTRTVLPNLQNCLKLNQSVGHKLSQSSTKFGDSPAMKVPFTTSFVKLLKKLPSEYVSDALRPIIPTFCSHLKSKDHLVRDPVRKTLAMLLKELGALHFPKIVNCLLAILKRGYERHVLSYTVSYLLKECESELRLRPNCVPHENILSICEEELFGEVQAEKDVQAIKEKTREARKDNAGQILECCAMLTDRINVLEKMVEIPTKTLCSELTSNDKMIKNARHWLDSVRKGIVRNQNVPFDQILEFLRSRLEKLSEKTKTKDESKTSKKMKSIYDIPSLKKCHPDYPESKALIIEFIYDLLWTGLKNGDVHKKDCVSFVDNLLIDLDGATRKMELLAMRCLTLMLCLDVFNFTNDVERITKAWNKVVLKMSTYCLSSSTNSETVNAIFKFVTTFMESFPTFKIMVDDYKLMLRSIRCFLDQENCSSSALSLLKRLILGKYDSKELKDLMKEVQKQSITNNMDHVLDSCREVTLEYVRAFCTTFKQCEEFLTFTIDQLKYNESKGRLSAAKTLSCIVQMLPEKVYMENAKWIFVRLVVAIDQETSQGVTDNLCETFGYMIQKDATQEHFIEIIEALISDPEKENSYATLARIVSIIILKCYPNILNSEKLKVLLLFFERILNGDAWSEAAESEEYVQLKDHATFYALDGLKDLFERYFEHSKGWNSQGKLEQLCSSILELTRDNAIDYGHDWVQVRSLDLLNVIFCNISVSTFLKCKKVAQLKYCTLIDDPNSISTLIRKISKMLVKNFSGEKKEQAIKNLTILIHLAIKLYESAIDDGILQKFMNSLRHMINTEVTQNPDKSELRRIAYEVYLVLIEVATSTTVDDFSKNIVHFCVRDATDSNAPAEVIQSAEQVMANLKLKIGDQKYLVLHAASQESLATKRQLNRAKKKETLILVPGLKRKRSATSGKKKFKKRKSS